MREDMASLIERIREAFEACPPPADDEITESGCCAECDALANWLRGRTWEELLGELIADQADPDPPFLLKPPAFRYFAPAYLIAALSAGEAEGRNFSPSFAFAPDEKLISSFVAKYRDMFSLEERAAIVEYLTFLLHRKSEEAEFANDRIRYALVTIWGEPLGAKEPGVEG